MDHLSWFQRWMLRRIIKHLVIKRSQTTLFKMIYQANADVYYEDNIHTHFAEMHDKIESLYIASLALMREEHD